MPIQDQNHWHTTWNPFLYYQHMTRIPSEFNIGCQLGITQFLQQNIWYREPITWLLRLWYLLLLFFLLHIMVINASGCNIQQYSLGTQYLIVRLQCLMVTMDPMLSYYLLVFAPVSTCILAITFVYVYVYHNQVT